jgi:hypothetical protein
MVLSRQLVDRTMGMEHSGGRDSHDTNVSVRSHITFNGPIIILGGSLLVVFVAIGGFIFFSYVFTHWGIFTKRDSPHSVMTSSSTAVSW